MPISTRALMIIMAATYMAGVAAMVMLATAPTQTVGF